MPRAKPLTDMQSCKLRRSRLQFRTGPPRNVAPVRLPATTSVESPGFADKARVFGSPRALSRHAAESRNMGHQRQSTVYRVLLSARARNGDPVGLDQASLEQVKTIEPHTRFSRRSAIEARENWAFEGAQDADQHRSNEKGGCDG